MERGRAVQLDLRAAVLMGRGRDLLLTPAVQQNIVNALKAGNRLLAAARAFGVKKTTLYIWLQLSADDRPCVRPEERHASVREHCDMSLEERPD